MINPAWRVLMRYILKQFKQILFTTIALLYTFVGLTQQVKHKPTDVKPIIAKPASSHLNYFYQLANNAGVAFTFPDGFKEARIVNNEDFSFDYAIEIPGHEFEIWFQVKSQKANWADYERLKNDPGKNIANPDSLYIQIGQAEASALTSDQPCFTRSISQEVLDRYNANAGKSYLLDLADLSVTKHYKYALLLTLQKDHIGTILAVCFTNEKSPEFFKNINRMSRYIKFKF